MAKNLLLTDRKPYSTMDGSTGWSSLVEASDSLLSKGHFEHCLQLFHKLSIPALGWYWDGSDSNGLAQWNVDVSQVCSDSEGWIYSVDFSSFVDEDSGTAVKGMIHFVRRKRLYCTKLFDGYEFLYMRFFFIFLMLRII